MQIIETNIPDVKLLTPVRHQDSRGFFSEVFNAGQLAEAGIYLDIAQENYSHSTARHTVRGLHFQSPPFAQHKLVQVVSGSIIDVAVDLRQGSPWYGSHVAVELSADNWQQLWVPEGFAHGFCTLEPDTAVIYKVSAGYSREHDGGVRWNDPQLGIKWPADSASAVLSDKDQKLPWLANCPDIFSYDSGNA